MGTAQAQGLEMSTSASRLSPKKAWWIGGGPLEAKWCVAASSARQREKETG